MWNNEILVGFVEAKYAESRGLHTYDQKSARHKYARSLDGGKTWSIEDAYDAGQKAIAYDHTIAADKAVVAKALDQPMDFTHPEFVLAFVRLNNNDDGQLPADFAGVRWYGLWKSKVSHGLNEAEELLPTPAQRTVRPKPRNESLCELVGKGTLKKRRTP